MTYEGEERMNGINTNVAIIGAGPYGLAAAAHLRAANVETAVFGRTMEFWKHNMPAGMLLRSPWHASHIAGIDGLTLDNFYREEGMQPSEPVSLRWFIEYGSWFQRRAAPELDERRVTRLEKRGDGFHLSLEDGGSLMARRVVIATGIGSFAYKPEVFDHAPRELASHSADHVDLRRFEGKSVVIVGRGQSALESAALLAECGAAVELIARTPDIRWLHAREILRSSWNPLRRLFFHPTDVGPALFTQIAARPEWFQRIPAQWQPWFGYRCIRPAGAA
jgi:cation diffusion facilitator CzcD-associated flavoprotein CzcO